MGKKIGLGLTIMQFRFHTGSGLVAKVTRFSTRKVTTSSKYLYLHVGTIEYK